MHCQVSNTMYVCKNYFPWQQLICIEFSCWLERRRKSRSADHPGGCHRILAGKKYFRYLEKGGFGWIVSESAPASGPFSDWGGGGGGVLQSPENPPPPLMATALLCKQWAKLGGGSYIIKLLQLYFIFTGIHSTKIYQELRLCKLSLILTFASSSQCFFSLLSVVLKVI